MNPPHVDPEFLALLRCPESFQRLRIADPAVIEKLNQQVAAGLLRNHSGQTVIESLDGGLVRDDSRRLYPIRHEIPIMLVDESIVLD